MAFDGNQFRKAFPEFGSTDKYPDALIASWGAVATTLVDPRRWRSNTTLGINLYVAHEVTLQGQSVANAAIGGVPGAQSGPANSKTVGSVTVAYDTQQTAEKDAGWWNLTTYGKQYIRLARLYGAGAVQL